jgi:DNA-binding Xre family transcriptional regulator
MVKLKVREIAEKVGIKNAAQLRARTGLGMKTSYQLWNGETELLSLQTLNTLCNVLQVGPALLLEYTPDVGQQGEPGQGGQATKPERRSPVKVKRKTKHTSSLRIVAAAG